MLNRRHIRIKVIQTLYASEKTESENVKVRDNFLDQSLDSTYDLYLSILSLLIKMHEKAKDRYEKSQNKLVASSSNRHGNLKLVNNEVFVLLSTNSVLRSELETKKIDPWYLDFEYVDIIYKAMLESDICKAYLAKSVSTFKEDKQFMIDIFEEIVAPNNKLYDYFEDKKLTWLDDIPVVNTNIVKILKKLKPSSPKNHFLPKLFRDEEDRVFAKDLLKKTLLNQTTLNKEIASKTKNWDSDRITQIDTVLMQMAICEFQYFPSIPVKVSINEYLEIAKEYSTPKSSTFINGILDKIVKEYTTENKLNKIGRGLM